jgi:hypothetical protein
LTATFDNDVWKEWSLNGNSVFARPKVKNAIVRGFISNATFDCDVWLRRLTATFDCDVWLRRFTATFVRQYDATLFYPIIKTRRNAEILLLTRRLSDIVPPRMCKLTLKRDVCLTMRRKLSSH